MKLQKEQEMPLLARKRQTFVIEHHKDKTPSRLELRAQVAKHNKTKEDLVNIRHVYQQYGEGKSKIIAHVYNDAKLCQKLDPLRKKDQERMKKQAEAKQKAAQEKKAQEAPKETEEKKEQEAPKAEEEKTV